MIVIGASAGGFDGIQEIVRGLPGDFDAAVFVVWHISPNVKGMLPQVLNKVGALRAAHALDGEPIEMGKVYVAPPDYHMILEKDRIRLSKGPKENRFRPAVDPLFRSAAFVFGEQVIGVILSGGLDDGSAGLWAVKEFGGVAIVQDPDQALAPAMPQNALQAVAVDHVLPVNEIATCLVRINGEKLKTTTRKGSDFTHQTQLEIDIAMDDKTVSTQAFANGELSPFTCPECHGVLSALKEGKRIRFRCHTGHAFSSDALLAAISENIEQSLWSSVRSIQESIFLLNHMGDHFAEANQPKVASLYFRKAKEAEHRAEIVRKAFNTHVQLTREGIEQHEEQGNESNQ